MKWHSYETIQSAVRFHRAVEALFHSQHHEYIEVEELRRLRDELDEFIGHMEKDAEHPLNREKEDAQEGTVKPDKLQQKIRKETQC